MENTSGSFEKEHQKEDSFVTINTIEQTVYVERLPNAKHNSRGTGDILKYGDDNLYPQKVQSMAQRSQSTSSAINTSTRFSTGQGFEVINGQDINEIIVNDEDQTLKDILDHAANEKSVLGVALHFNYNAFGEIMEIQEVGFETLRWKKTKEGESKKLVFCEDWSRTSSYNKKDKTEYNIYNPETVISEIEHVGGLENYNGQILYWIPKKKDIYTLSRFDPCLDDTQFEHESGVYKLRNIQNGYSANYVMFYPSVIESELEKYGIIREHKGAKGAGNSGKTKHVPVNASAFEALGGRKLIEPIPKSNIDLLFVKQNQETKDNIFATFNQPMILNGITKDGMFNQESFIDAFDYYNSITEKDRQVLERIFNSFLPNTIWAIDKVEIIPLEFLRKRDEEEALKEPEEKIEIEVEPKETE